jgi:hypothetical protein
MVGDYDERHRKCDEMRVNCLCGAELLWRPSKICPGTAMRVVAVPVSGSGQMYLVILGGLLCVAHAVRHTQFSGVCLAPTSSLNHWCFVVMISRSQQYPEGWAESGGVVTVSEQGLHALKG